MKILKRKQHSIKYIMHVIKKQHSSYSFSQDNRLDNNNTAANRRIATAGPEGCRCFPLRRVKPEMKLFVGGAV